MVLPEDRDTNLAIWAVTVGVAAALQATALLSRRVPGVVVVVGVLRRWRALRLFVVLGWAWVGWHLFVRTSF